MCLAFENRCLGITASKERLPLLLVTGFLGSGKTTLLRHLLGNKSNLRLAVLVNELGTIDIDGALLRSTDNNAGLGICTQELTNGCLCCTVKDDLRRAVLSVLERRDSVDYLVIETSGAADPRPVAAALAQLCRLDLVVTVVDGTAAVQQAHMALFRSQLGAADLVLLNKSDLLDEEELALRLSEREALPISALKRSGIEALLHAIDGRLPLGTGIHESWEPPASRRHA